MAFRLESPSFKDGDRIPSRFTCDGQDLSPALRWSDPPSGTQSYALLCDDPDAPGRIFVHWVLFNIPPSPMESSEGLPAGGTLPNGARQGVTDFGRTGYGGPCPPSGVHRYFFKLYALSRPLDLPPGVTKSQVEKAMGSLILGEARLVGRYSRTVS